MRQRAPCVEGDELVEVQPVDVWRVRPGRGRPGRALRRPAERQLAGETSEVAQRGESRARRPSPAVTTNVLASCAGAAARARTTAGDRLLQDGRRVAATSSVGSAVAEAVELGRRAGVLGQHLDEPGSECRTDELAVDRDGTPARPGTRPSSRAWL